MSIQICDMKCPKCGSINWINNGDTDDITAPDVDAIRCWSCSHEYFTWDDVKLMYGDDVQPCDTIIEDGKRTAAEAAGGKSNG